MEINNPHDKFFRESLSRIEIARGLMKNYLPQKVLELIDLNNIMIEKDSFIEQELEDFYSDVLYQVDLSGQEAYLYFLFEHKSYPDSKIALQLLKYMVKIWELKLKQGKSKKLPIIIPMVIYHGQDNWDIGLDLAGLMEDVPRSLEAYIPNYRYLLEDLSDYSHEEIKGYGLLSVFLEILSSLARDDFIDRFQEALRVLEKLREQNKGIEYFETVIRYILGYKDNLEVEDLKKVAEKITAERGEEIMAIADRLKKEGKREIVVEMLRNNEDMDKISEYTGFSKEKLKEINKEIKH